MWYRRALLGGLALVIAQAARAGDQFFTFSGVEVGSSLGRSVDGAGDVNGDGVGDIVTSSYLAFGLGGAVTVRSGKDGSVLHSWTGPQSFGQCVAGAGDVNADGFADVIVGELGKITVFSGRTGAALHVRIDVAGKLGASVDGAGDLDHDGYADFVAGAPEGEIVGKYGTGYVRVWSGQSGVVLMEQTGDLIGDWFGYSVSGGGGDVNKDGYPDIIVGAPRYYFHAFLGRACVISGKDGAYLFQVKGSADSFCGGSVAGGADLNRDGYADFVIGSRDEHIDFGGDIPNVGFARAYSGKDFSLLHEWAGEAANARFGAAVAMVGKVDDDLYPDVAVGEPGMGSLFSIGRVQVLSGKDGDVVRQWGGRSFTSVKFGTAVAGLGDINNDGFADVIASDPGDSTGGSSAGQVTVYSGLGYAGSWSNYGAGWPGTFGVPALTVTGTPELCDSILIEVSNSRQSITPGILIAGFSQGAIDSHQGGLVLVGLPWFVFPVTVPRIGLDLHVDIPCDTTLAGVELYLQAIEVDPGASWGASFTRGLEIVLGL